MSENKEKMVVDGLHTNGIRTVNVSFPSNSHKSKAIDENKEKPKLQKIVNSGVVQKKKPFTKKISEAILGDDSKNVGQYLLYDVLVPAAKDTLSDLVTGGVEMLLFGERRAKKHNSNANRSYVSYSGYYNNKKERSEISPRNRVRHSFDDIILVSRGEAEHVIDMLVDQIEEYDQVTVADLYDLVGITSQFTDHKYGWTNLRDASVSRVREGYLLDLPRPVLLD